MPLIGELPKLINPSAISGTKRADPTQHRRGTRSNDRLSQRQSPCHEADRCSTKTDPSSQTLNEAGVFIWSNYSDLTRPHPKWWFRKGNPLISGNSRLVKYSVARESQSRPRLVKYHNSDRFIYIYPLKYTDVGE